MKLQELKTFENACEVLGLDPEKVLPDFSCYPEADRKALEAQAKLFIIVKAANKIANKGKEWIPNWDDSSQYKYENWFYMSSSGFRFSDCVSWHSYSPVGSRLCFISSEVGKYVANTFIDLYRDLFVK